VIYHRITAFTTSVFKAIVSLAVENIAVLVIKDIAECFVIYLQVGRDVKLS
jgi:hypothetical protein